jgi:hypothetical protein
VVLADPFIEDDSEIFRFILLSSVDLERSHQATTLNRIQQLFEFTHGDNIAVLFLLCDDASNSSQPSMGPFMELHIQYVRHRHHSPCSLVALWKDQRRKPTSDS